jgi:hypothetical protein
MDGGNSSSKLSLLAIMSIDVYQILLLFDSRLVKIKFDSGDLLRNSLVFNWTNINLLIMKYEHSFKFMCPTLKHRLHNIMSPFQIII